MVAKLADFEHVERILLKQTPIPNEVEAEFAALHSILALGIDSQGPTPKDIHISMIRGMRRLSILMFNGNFDRVDVDHLVASAEADKIQGLLFRHVILQGDVMSLSRLSSLRVIVFEGTNLTPKQLELFKSLPALRYINYSFNPITDDHRALFKSLKGVRTDVLFTDDTSESFGPPLDEVLSRR
jgi:hypothetical protein